MVILARHGSYMDILTISHTLLKTLVERNFMTIPVLMQAKQRWCGNAAQLWIFFQGAMLLLACSMLVIVGPFIVCPPKSLGYDIWSSSYSYNWGSIVNLISISWILRLLVAEKWSSSPRIDQGFNQGMIQIRGTHRNVSLKACTDSTECQDFAELQGLSSHLYTFSQQAGPEDGRTKTRAENHSFLEIAIGYFKIIPLY